MNVKAVAEYLVSWLRNEVEKAGAKGVVLGISGGIDSAVAAVLAQKAWGENCLGLILPCESSVEDRMHAQLLVDTFKINHRIVELTDVYRLLTTKFESYLKIEGVKGRLLRANIKPRLRMITLYYSAQARDYLVVGTSNKSEISIGYATKHGDSAVDLQLLGDLLKEEVYELAHYLGIPEEIINKPPSAGLWEGQTDEGEMGITYAELDTYLKTGEGRPEVVEIIQDMHRKSEHKRRMPPIAYIPAEYK
ncbi:NH(3)-dependent NAD(+) synthetase [Thermosyntropha lipolytica DSM 11003]|uniref:NH(3)-dependent NAD(+) synthetase n=1 Tax=Thermosyntropha lipolytica DSM 11003 TaxID=1123382 RepID=A0A1M5PBY3_9FIRM|nr:NAD(+) synthase [Thermosyntropha lipolytica]SHG98733.1 NH(3)-dependent NAD(+) synthetase [Thermosyntropha lipolytica DSM 11003]